MRALCSAALIMVVIAAPEAPARATEADISYDIDLPSKPLHDALIDLALQTNISIGGVDPARCGAMSAPVHGKMKAERALRGALAGGRCDIRRYDARTFRLDMKHEPKSAANAPIRDIAPPTPTEEVLILRRPAALNAIPRAISIVPGAVLSGSDLDLNQLAARVPGMAVTNLGPGRDKILLRGISDSVLTGRTQSTVGLYLDDSPITYNAPDPDLLLVDMARVEVLKGPQGALYGQGSLAGVVRLVTNKPRIDTYESDVGVGLGMTEGGQMSWRATAMLNLPIMHNKAGLRAVAYNDESGGFIKDQTGIKKTTNSTVRSGGRLGLAWPIDDHFYFTATAVAQRLNSENSQYVFGQTRPYRRELAVAEPHNNAFDELSAGLKGEFESGTLQVAVNHLNHDLSSGYDAQPLQRFVSVPTSGVLFYDESQSMSLSSVEVSFVSPTHQRLRWLGGLFVARSTEHFDPHLMDVFTAHELYDEARTDRIDDTALFGQLAFDFTPNLTGSMGLRSMHSGHETDSHISNVHLTGYGTSGQINGKLDSRHLAHSFLLNYHPQPGLLFYAQAADGFRTGGFNTTTQMVTSVPPVYLDDALSSIEAGVKFNTPDNRVRLNLTGFQIWWQDIQSDQLRSTGLPITLNIGDGGNSGAEFEADWTVTRALALHVAAQVNDPRLRRPNPVFSADKDGGMPFISRQNMSLSADWTQAVFSHRLESSLTLSYRSPSPLNYGALRTVQMDPYTNLDLSSFINFGKVRIGARIYNATGVKSNSFAYGNPFSLEGSSQITPLRPRTLWLSVNRRY